MNRGDVYWIRVDDSTGGEIRKSRPAIVVSNDKANMHLNRIQIVPLTTNVERIYPGEAFVKVEGRKQKALATQLTTVAKNRVMEKVGRLTDAEMVAVERAIKVQLGMS